MDIQFEHQTGLAGCSVIHMDGIEVATIVDPNEPISKEEEQRREQALLLMLASPDMYRDLLYLMQILRSIPSDVLDKLEQNEDIDFSRVMNTLRKAGYEAIKWPLRPMPKDSGSEG